MWRKSSSSGQLKLEEEKHFGYSVDFLSSLKVNYTIMLLITEI